MSCTRARNDGEAEPRSHGPAPWWCRTVEDLLAILRGHPGPNPRRTGAPPLAGSEVGAPGDSRAAWKGGALRSASSRLGGCSPGFEGPPRAPRITVRRRGVHRVQDQVDEACSSRWAARACAGRRHELEGRLAPASGHTVPRAARRRSAPRRRHSERRQHLLLGSRVVEQPAHDAVDRSSSRYTGDDFGRAATPQHLDIGADRASGSPPRGRSGRQPADAGELLERTSCPARRAGDQSCGEPLGEGGESRVSASGARRPRSPSATASAVATTAQRPQHQPVHR